jgi:hypothetical protein
VVIARIAAQERDPSVLRAIADDEAENLRIEIDHLRHVGHIEADVAEARRLLDRHKRSLLDE